MTRPSGAGKIPLYTMLFSLLLNSAGCGWYVRLHSAKGPPFTPVSQIPQGMSVVYVYGPLGYGNYKYPIVLNDQIIITELKKGGYYPFIVGPGKLKITMVEWSEKQRKQVGASAVVGTLTGGLVTGIVLGALASIPEISHSTTFTVESGKSYYVEHVGTLMLDLEMKTEAEAMPKLTECVLLPPFAPEE